jgi:hypothetical protein
MTHTLTEQELSILASIRQAMANLEQQYVGAQKAICAVNGIKGTVRFTETSIETVDEEVKP